MRALNFMKIERTQREPRPRLPPRGLPPALAPWEIGHTEDVGEAALLGEGFWGRHRVVCEGASDEFSATFHGTRIRGLTLGYVDYSVSVRLEIETLPDEIVVVMPATGESRLSEPETVQLSPVMAATFSSRVSARVDCPVDCAHLLVVIERQTLELHLSRLLGRLLLQPLELDLPFDLTRGSASRWSVAVQMLLAELLDETSLLHRSVGVGQLEEFAMSSLLYGQASNYTTQLHGDRVGPGAVVRAGCAFIDTNLADAISVPDVARSAGVSARTLQKQFLLELGQSPSDYIRLQRLERVRAALMDAVPSSGISVASAARRWGFRHVGRFATQYRDRYGELPSATLRA